MEVVNKYVAKLLYQDKNSEQCQYKNNVH